MRTIFGFLFGGGRFSRVRLTFWYFFPLYLLVLTFLFLAEFVPASIPSNISDRFIVMFMGIYIMLGFLISGWIIYKTLGDKTHLSVMLRTLLAFVLVVWGGMIDSALFGNMFRGVPTELYGDGLNWIKVSTTEGNRLEGAVKTVLVVSGFYVALSFMYSIIPACVILVLVGKNRS
ncbi:hypothetical protein [Hydrogenophaga sp. PAMC20947]|uniref:hypothetical protein n=1 Tax=Hydrogenophaga sp. PAMC20947 TaxID=2565558 RepID=UPI00109D8558|nr:hypothetical protein [Hydrogenophaga sp. PAMC20947]QCB45485.1 hypothetical protein E5678_05265 [Hydrogenophaga sp. PAMC20947]